MVLIAGFWLGKTHKSALWLIETSINRQVVVWPQKKISLDIDIFSEIFLYLYTRKPTLYMDIYVLDLMGSNCTFMELKFQFNNYCISILKVLIVPLWNWNVVRSEGRTSLNTRSNCTFMELKLRSTIRKAIVGNQF